LVDVLAVKFRETLSELTPVADSGSLMGEFRALLTIEMLPTTLPVAWGAKVTLKEVLCPGVRVNGKARPLTLNPAPATAA